MQHLLKLPSVWTSDMFLVPVDIWTLTSRAMQGTNADFEAKNNSFAKSQSSPVGFFPGKYSVVLESVLLYFEKVYFWTLRVYTLVLWKILLYSENIFLYSENIFVYFESILVYFDSILWYFGAILLYPCQNVCFRLHWKSLQQEQRRGRN